MDSLKGIQECRKELGAIDDDSDLDTPLKAKMRSALVKKKIGLANQFAERVEEEERKTAETRDSGDDEP